MKWSLPKAIGIIVASLLLVTGTTHLTLRRHQRMQVEKRLTNNYRITAISQASHTLSTDYLAELMHLSRDKPTRLSRFNLTKAHQRLLSSPLIREATITPKKPGALIVTYVMREPLLALADFTNLAIDEEGVPVPLTPYLTPKNLPNVYLGLETPPSWNTPIEHPSLDLVHTIYSLCLEYHLPVTHIDVAKATSRLLGEREIVLSVDGHILRLTPKDLSQQLANYLELRPDLLSCNPYIIDLRLNHLAYIGGG